MDKQTRLEKRAEVLLQPGSGGYMVSGYTKNISSTGLYAEVEEKFPIGTKMLVVIRHPTNGQTCAVEGQVADVRDDGMDITYNVLSSRSNEYMDKILSSL